MSRDDDVRCEVFGSVRGVPVVVRFSPAECRITAVVPPWGHSLTDYRASAHARAEFAQIYVPRLAAVVDATVARMRGQDRRADLTQLLCRTPDAWQERYPTTTEGTTVSTTLSVPSLDSYRAAARIIGRSIDASRYRYF